MTRRISKVGCGSCHWVGWYADLLTAINPFNADDIIHGCPHCREVAEFRAICDEPGCVKYVECGTPTLGGYRSTCHEHAP